MTMSNQALPSLLHWFPWFLSCLGLVFGSVWRCTCNGVFHCPSQYSSSRLSLAHAQYRVWGHCEGFPTELTEVTGLRIYKYRLNYGQKIIYSISAFCHVSTLFRLIFHINNRSWLACVSFDGDGLSVQQYLAATGYVSSLRRSAIL